jgi:hypothetical protein
MTHNKKHCNIKMEFVTVKLGITEGKKGGKKKVVM